MTDDWTDASIRAIKRRFHVRGRAVRERPDLRLLRQLRLERIRENIRLMPNISFWRDQ